MWKYVNKFETKRDLQSGNIIKFKPFRIVLFYFLSMRVHNYIAHNTYVQLWDNISNLILFQLSVVSKHYGHFRTLNLLVSNVILILFKMLCLKTSKILTTMGCMRSCNRFQLVTKLTV